MRLGVFGGTFDPIHLGHLRAAEEVREALSLDRVLFVPAALPPHKASQPVGDKAKRLGLVRLAIGDNPFFSASDLELNRTGPSYSIDTVRELAREYRPEALWFIMGTDQYRELHTWMSYRELVGEVDIAVMRRPPDAGRFAPPRGVEEEYLRGADGFLHRSGRQVRLVQTTGLDISSTEIRRLLAAGGSIRYLVDERVRAALETTHAHEGPRTEVK